MSEYRRLRIKGATYFLTLVTFRRRPVFAEDAKVSALRAALKSVRVERPFRIPAMVLLPDHLHLLALLPDDDDDYSTRMALFKKRLTQAIDAPPSSLPSRKRCREAEVWQCRFWEHTVRNDDEIARITDYIHYNPVPHGYVRCPPMPGDGQVFTSSLNAAGSSRIGAVAANDLSRRQTSTTSRTFAASSVHIPVGWAPPTTSGQ